MGCIYNSYDGECTLWEEDYIAELGCDEKGYCIVDCDPNPIDSCCNYESDYTCSSCGADLNVEECYCENI